MNICANYSIKSIVSQQNLYTTIPQYSERNKEVKGLMEQPSIHLNYVHLNLLLITERVMQTNRSPRGPTLAVPVRISVFLGPKFMHQGNFIWH